MGCLPLERTSNVMGGNDCISRYNDVALEFNNKLKSLTVSLNKELPGIKLVFSNPYYIFLHMIRRPSSYGKASPRLLYICYIYICCNVLLLYVYTYIIIILTQPLTSYHNMKIFKSMIYIYMSLQHLCGHILWVVGYHVTSIIIFLIFCDNIFWPCSCLNIIIIFFSK